MGDAGKHQPTSERPSLHGYPPHSAGQHMSPAETSALHSYAHPHHTGAAMPSNWNPTPSPYNESNDHRSQHPDTHSQPPQHPYPHHYGPPPPPPPGQPVDPAYARHGSSSAPSRSPPNHPPPQYPPSAPPVNGTGPPTAYYPPPPHEYRDRPTYGPPDGQPNGNQPPLHVTTSHEMMPGQPQSAPPLGYGPPSAGPPPGTPYGPSWGPGAYDQNYARRKPVRAAQACDPCRQRKAKCDEGRPTCTHCKDNNLSCTYRDIPPQKNEKHAIAIQDKLDGLTGHVERMMEKWESQESKLDRLISLHEGHHHRLKALESTSPVLSLPETKPVARREDGKADGEHFSVQDLPPDAATLRTAAPANSQTSKSVAAANLLAWPVIKRLIPSDHKPSYIMDTESTRGLLRLHGCGEGEDKTLGQDAASSPATSSSSGRLEEESVSASPSGVWGIAQFVSSSSHPLREHPGGLAPHGGLLFDADVVDKLHLSYLDNMYKLHPFLEKVSLRKMITVFKQRYSWDFKPTRAMSSVGVKRKREESDSPNSAPDDYTRPPATRPTAHASVLIEHSVTNAIILLVLALGKVCAYTDPLPGPPQPANAVWTSTPHNVYSDLPLPSSASTPASPYTSGLNGHVGPRCKNMDVIPGLAYFSKAADILGEMPGGVDVTHVQANLLAGLYMGQLGRILPSHWYIRNACTAIQVVINSSPYKEKRISAARRNLINFAFWSCLQLESDLLAEMDLPASGILTKEGEMLYEKPAHLTLYDGEGVDSSRVIEEHRHYSYQIGLRKILNDSLDHIYRTNRDGELPPKSVIGAFGAYLQDFRRVLADWDWDDNDHQSPDTNVARLRGKYYGAKYIIHRPALYYALNFLTSSAGTSHRPSASPATITSGSPALSNHPEGRGLDNRPPLLNVYEPIEEWILDAAKSCIHAAIRSTTCFDKVPPRLVITNIFGTAHAQFGNVLVLSATYCSQHPQLRHLVKEGQLRFLLDRTIKFLQKHEAISPSLGKDAVILQHVRSHIFNVPFHPTSAASSFSSSR